MMGEIFLQQVQLADFRTFGEFTLRLPPGPGLTLLVGTNGLGKSSFFDGIEWCLTGHIRRFQDHVGRLKEADYLTRRDAKPGSHAVSLAFTEGDEIARGFGAHPDDDALAALLKNPEWTDIKDLAAYLGFTHFLGQASQQRFTSRDQSDQWQALKGPSGIDRLEAIRTALRGRGATLAFNRRTDREELKVQLAEQALMQWRDDAKRLADLRARSAVAGAEPQEALETRLVALEQALPADDKIPQAYLDRLTRIRSGIEAAQRKAAEERQGLEQLRAIAVRFADAASQAASVAEQATGAQSAVSVATADLTAAALASTDAERAAGAQAELVARAESQQESLARVRSAVAEYGLLEEERRSCLDDEKALHKEQEARQQEIAVAGTALDNARAAQQALAGLDADYAALQLWSERVGALQSQNAIAQARRGAAEASATAAERARASLPELERTAQDRQEATDAAEHRLAARRRDASELAELISGLAAHIGHDDTDCPICAHAYPPGELQARARDALAKRDDGLAAEVRALDALRDQAADAAKGLARARADIEAATTAAADAAQAEAAVALERAAIADGLQVRVTEDLTAVVAARLADVAGVRAAQMQSRDDGPGDAATAQTRLDGFEAALASLKERAATVAQRRARAEASLSVLEEALAQHPKPWTVEAADAALEAHTKILTETRARLTDLSAAMAAVASAETVARERVAAAEAASSQLVDAGQRAERARLDTLAAWQGAGMAGEPSENAIAAMERELIERTTSFATWLDETTVLAKAYEAWLAQDQLRGLIKAMEDQAGAGAAENPALHEKSLQDRLNATRAALRLTGETREGVVAYGEKLKAEAEAFSTKFLLPLNDLIDAFNRALLSTPGETVQFTAAHTVERTALTMQLRYADEIDNAQYKTELPPQLVLSEGQMAANGFSILCAASTAYHWSRWRALLLDDPLQHNDIIHAAAFVDVMRNLVELKRYQLVMSTHGLDEGEFISRKFDAANLPCAVVELTGASKEGVLVEAPRYNLAARRLLEEPTAKFA